MNGQFSASANAFRIAITKHDLPEPAVRILDQVLRYSLDRGQLKAIIPLQKCLCMLCGLDQGQVSRAMTCLKKARILCTEEWQQGRGRAWQLFSLRPPDQWLAPLRVEESARLSDLEAWLQKLSLDQLEMLPPPPSLNDLLCELFIECSAPSKPGRVESNPLRPANDVPQRGSSNSSLYGNCESIEAVPGTIPPPTVAVDPQTINLSPRQVCPRQEGDTCSPEAPPRSSSGGKLVSQTSLSPVSHVSNIDARARAPIDRSIRLIESKSTEISIGSIDRSKEEAEKLVSQTSLSAGSGPGEFRLYVENRLFRLIGEHEREGPMGQTWRQAIAQIPRHLDCLLSTVESMRRENRLQKKPVQWLNASVRSALALKKSPAPQSPGPNQTA